MRPQTKTDEEILDAARKIFFQKGTQASVQTIADEVGISQPALFKRFGTKKELIERALSGIQEPSWFTTADREITDRPFAEQLKDLLREIYEFFNTMHPIFLLIRNSGINPHSIIKHAETPLPEKGRKKLTEWLEKCYEKGLIRECNFRMAATHILGMAHFESFTNSIISDEDTSEPLKIDDTYLDEAVKQITVGIQIKEK